MKTTIGAVLIVKNEALMLENALKTLKWCDEIVIIDNNSSDQTLEIAKKYTKKIFSTKESSFAGLRNFALDKVKSDYIFYIDADERVTPGLKKEIVDTLESNASVNLKMKRRSMFYGKYFNFGNWQNDWVLRIFYKKNLIKWTGDIHETALFKNETIELKEKLIHLTHRNTKDNILKTASWTGMEADLLAKKNLRVTPLIILRKGVMEFLRRYFFYKGYRDGMEGFIESLMQAINKFLIYIQVWEFKQNPKLSEKYKKEDERIIKLWKEKN